MQNFIKNIILDTENFIKIVLFKMIIEKRENVSTS
jgi:hypothetical protein